MPLNNSFGLGFVFSAKDNASSVFKTVDRNFTKLDKSVDAAQRRTQAAQGAVTAGLAAMATGAFAVQKIMGAAFNAGIFEQQAQRVGAIANATSATLEQLRQKALAAGLATQFSPTEAIQGLGELTVRGLTATQAMQSLDGSLDLAAGGMISIQSASSTMVSALKVFGIEASGAVLVADKLLKISNLTALSALDLELALGTVGRGAGATKQSLDEMLISIGLVKNTGVDASVAASSVSAALLFMAKQASKFKDMGVAVTDSTGKFRPFINIILDAHQAMSGITDQAERAAKAQELFGRFGITAFTAIGGQLANGITTTTGKILKGAEALAFMRKEIAQAAGTAARFRDAILNTLPGQLTLLTGTLQTFGVVFGKELALALKPIVAFIRDAVGHVIKFFQSLPNPMKRAIAVGALVGAMFIFMAGAAFVLIGAFILALPIIKATLAVMVGFIPIIAAVAAAAVILAGVLFTLKRAFDLNIGGFGDTVRDVFGKVKLFFQALFQFMEQGFFSGDLAKKLGQPENAPVMKFLITMIRFGFRVKRFFDGLSSGFNAFLISNSGAFSDLGDAIKAMGEALGIVGGAADDSLGPSSGFAKFGKLIGKGLALFFTNIIRVISIVIRISAGMWKGFIAGMKFMSPLFEVIGEAFGEILDSFMELADALGLVSEKGDGFGGVWETIGKVMGVVRSVFIMPIIAAFAILVKAISFVLKIAVVMVKGLLGHFGNMWDFMKGLLAFVTGDFSGGWDMMGDAIKAQLKTIINFFKGMLNILKDQFSSFLDFIANMAAKIPAKFRPAALDAFVAQRQLHQLTVKSEAGDQERDAKAFSLTQLNALASRPVIPFANQTTGAVEAGSGGKGGITKDEFTEAMSEVLAEHARNNATKPGTQTINLVVDGETVGSAQAKADERNAALAFGGDFFGD